MARILNEPTELSELFKCPKNKEIMVDPVTTADGYTFERCIIEDHLQTHDTNPVTGETLSSKSLIPNRALKNLIRIWQAFSEGSSENLFKAWEPDLECPISYELCENPVLTAEGFTYNKQNVSDWFKNHNTNPVTNTPLANTNLVPNRVLQKFIQVWKQLKPLTEDTQAKEPSTGEAMLQASVSSTTSKESLPKNKYTLFDYVQEQLAWSTGYSNLKKRLQVFSKLLHFHNPQNEVPTHLSTTS